MPARLQEYRVEIGNSHQDTVTFDSGVKLYQDTWLEQQEKVTLAGTVTYVPPRNEFGAQKGDKIIFRYDVVGDMDARDGYNRVYANQIIMPGGKPEWFVHPVMIIAIEKNGTLQVGEKLVIGKKVKTKTVTSSLIIIPDQFAEKESNEILEVLYAHEKSGYKAGDKILVIPDFIQNYNFNSHYGQDVCVIKTNYILGKIQDQ